MIYWSRGYSKENIAGTVLENLCRNHWSSQQMSAHWYNLRLEWTTIPCLFVRRQQMSGVADKEITARSRTIGSPLCSLSVGEPGDPGCGAGGWNTEGSRKGHTVDTVHLLSGFICIIRMNQAAMHTGDPKWQQGGIVWDTHTRYFYFTLKFWFIPLFVSLL